MPYIGAGIQKFNTADSLTVNGDAEITGTVNPSGDTASGDAAAVGFTSTEGLILTGQGSTSDITVKNDADTTVFTVPTGTDDILFPDNAKAIFGAGSDLRLYHDGSNSYVEDAGSGYLVLKGSDPGIALQNSSAANLLLTGTNDISLLFSGNAKLATTNTGVDITGGFTATDGCTITTADNTTQLTLISTDTDANVGPILALQRNSASPADDDLTGKIEFNAEDSAGNNSTYASINTRIKDVTNGTEDGELTIQIRNAGSNREILTIKSEEVVFNEDSQDVNFRVESDNNTHAIFVNAGNDRVNINSSANPSESCQFYVNDVALIGGTNATTGGIFPTSGLGVITTQGTYCAVFYDDNNMGTPRCTIFRNGNLEITGALSKGSGSFRIDHPLPAKSSTHDLVHSFIEGPQADLIYRGKVDLVAGSATVNIDTAAGMTDGTFVLLCGDVQCFTSNEDGFTAVKGSVSGNTLTITAEADTCTDTISWMVVGERKDQHMVDTTWTDDNGKVIVEPLKGSQEVSEEE